MPDTQIMLTGNINQQSISRLMDEMTQRVGAGSRSVLLAMSTPGGEVYWGVTAYNFLRGLGIEVITHNFGQVDSIGGAIYVSGDRRLSVTQGRFLIHSISWNYQGMGNIAVPEKQLRDNLTQVERERDNLAAILSARTNKEMDAVRADMTQTRILDAQEATEYGFVHEINDQIFDPSQEIVNIGG
ncbi:MAG: ATP-dependent Clp protease, protease subunit [Gaiellaceae bacterium]|jgi:ATP-dependent Clp protease protease subunit|nr:ATP-dependent Clp protease, protease subunit [Gaiellaceae bacterium]